MSLTQAPGAGDVSDALYSPVPAILSYAIPMSGIGALLFQTIYF